MNFYLLQSAVKIFLFQLLCQIGILLNLINLTKLENYSTQIKSPRNFLILTIQFFKNFIKPQPKNMSDQQSIQFRNKSISELVHQLNNLGDTHIIIQPTSLIGIVDRESDNIRRFRSRSVNKMGVSREKGGESASSSRVRESCEGKGNGRQLLEFFLSDGSNKKYYYNEIVNQLEIPSLGKMLSMFEQGFNTSIVMQSTRERFGQILTKIEPWLECNQDDKYFYGSFLEYGSKQVVDLLGGKGKSFGLSEGAERDTDYYQTCVGQILNLTQTSGHLKILKAFKKNTHSSSSAQLRLILLPQQFLSLSPLINPNLKTTKSQLNQLLNYIKTNPTKKYENINKLLPKRYPLTTILAELLLYDSVNFCVNWVNDNGDSQYGYDLRKGKDEARELVNGRFQFYGKLANISNLVKKATNRNRKIVTIKAKKSLSGTSLPQSKPHPKKQSLQPSFQSHQPSPFESKQSPSQTQTNIKQPTTSELEYCRSLQRKTHKYSITQFSQLQLNNGDPLFPQTLPLYPKLSPELTEQQSITILKAQHAREVSQYHQTIQNLNKKILVLMEEKGYSEIYSIHEKQIMMLELKIQELRGVISKICGSKENKDNKDSRGNNSKEVQNLRQVVKKLNDQILNDKKNSMVTKLNQGKIKILEKQLTEWKQKYSKSEIARKDLKLQLQASINRLKLKDEQSRKIHEIQLKSQALATDSLAPKQLAILTQITELFKNGIPKQSVPYILQKFKNTLGTVSQLRQIILQCHNFLVDLQGHIEDKLGEKDPEVVLDCNRFIRGYLLENLDIF